MNLLKFTKNIYVIFLLILISFFLNSNIVKAENCTIKLSEKKINELGFKFRDNKNYKKAKDCFELNLEAQDVSIRINAIESMGSKYYLGEGTDKDYQKSLTYFFKAAKLGGSYAQDNIGYFYRDGLAGLEENLYESAKYYKAAAIQGHAIAQSNIGWFYEEGFGGFKKDLEKAFIWYNFAASQNWQYAKDKIKLSKFSKFKNKKIVTSLGSYKLVNKYNEIDKLRYSFYGIITKSIKSDKVNSKNYYSTKPFYAGARTMYACVDWDKVVNAHINKRQISTISFQWWTGSNLELSKKQALKKFKEFEDEKNCSIELIDLNLNNFLEIPTKVLAEFNIQLNNEELKIAKLKKLQSKELINLDEFNEKLLELSTSEDVQTALLNEINNTGQMNEEKVITKTSNKITQDLINNIVGYYKGELTYPNGDRLPIFSEIYLNDKNVLEGKYSFKDFGDEILLGKLTSFEKKLLNNIQLSWMDKYGRGWLKINLDTNGFNGSFGIKNNTNFEKIGDWSGNKTTFAKYNKDIRDILGGEIINNTEIKKIAEINNDTTAPKINIAKSFEAESNLIALIQGSVSDNSEIVQVTVDGNPINFINGKFNQKLFVKPGGQNILITAMDKFGNQSSKTVKLKRSSKKIITNFFDELNPTLINAKINPSAVALVIGIEDYNNTFAAPFAENDALAFNDFANTSLGVPQQNIKLLTNNNAGRTNTLKTLVKWLPKMVKENTSDVYVFFSGHGLASDDGEDLYLLPSDGDPELLEDSTLLRNLLFDRIAKLNPRSVTVFLDTCYSGATRTDEFLVAAKPIFIEAKEQDIPAKFTVFSASAGKETAKVLNEAEHGLFSYYMMKGLEGEADINSDRRITNGELITFINKNVSRQANQTPQLNGDPKQVLVQW